MGEKLCFDVHDSDWLALFLEHIASLIVLILDMRGEVAQRGFGQGREGLERTEDWVNDLERLVADGFDNHLLPGSWVVPEKAQKEQKEPSRSII